MKSATGLGYSLLGIINQGPQSGYDLCQIFETTPMGHYSSSPGAIYPALKRLEKDGLITGETERAETLRPRRIYRATPAGVSALISWVSKPVTRDDVVHGLEDLALRFAFMGGLVEDRLIHRFLTDLTTLIHSQVTELEAFASTMPDEPPTARLALESGIAQYKAVASWARRAAKEFETTSD